MNNDPSSPGFWPELFGIVLVGLGQTLYMVGVALAITIIVGLPLGIVLVGTERGGLFEAPFGSRRLGIIVHRVLDFIVNLGRSIPFIIVMIAIIPFTRLIVGTFIGTTAAIVPLSIVAIPFFARMVEIALKEIDPGLTEAAHSLGATRVQIVAKVFIPEALPSMILGLATTITSIINFSAMVGVVAGGGLGDVAFRYGYQAFSPQYVVVVIVVIFVLVQIIASLAAVAALRLSHSSSVPSLRSLLTRTASPASPPQSI